MSQTERQRRLRLLVKKLNKERKRQVSKVDILCNDLIGAQREFLRRLNQISFAARFYKGLLGTADLRTMVIQAGRLLREELQDTRIVFFLRQGEGGETRALDVDLACDSEEVRLEEYVSPSLAANVSRSNRLCTMEDLLGMGLEGNPQVLSRFSAATVPLNDMGRSLGFLLLCRAAESPLRTDELERVTLIMCGLSQAIRSCGVPLQSRE